MSAAEGLLSALEWNWRMVDTTLVDVDETLMARQPNGQCNSMAWILWHMNRVVDGFIHVRLQSKTQLWVGEGWYEKFAMHDDPDERGVGWSAAQVAAWRPPAKAVQMGYYEAVKQAARTYLSGLSDADLTTRRVIPPLPEPRTVAAALGQMTWDNVSHGGQLSYVRGLFEGMGWYPR
jgi:hypothetical protein